MNYIRTTTSAGFDWHDTFDDNQQILWNGNPVIYDVDTTVFTILRNTITDLALDTPCPFSMQDFQRITDTQAYTWTTKRYQEVTITKDSQTHIYHLLAYLCNGYDYNQYVHVYGIDEPVYLPVAKYYACDKCGGTRERFFCPDFFVSYEEAQAYLQNELANKSDAVMDAYDDYQVFVYPKDELVTSTWYQWNKLINTRIPNIPDYKNIGSPSIRVDIKNFTNLLNE